MCVPTRLARFSPSGKRRNPDATTGALRKEGSAQGWLPKANAQVCTVSSRKSAPSACANIDARVVTDELQVFFICERARTLPVAAHGVEGPHVGRAQVPGEDSSTLPPLRSKGAEVKSHLRSVSFPRKLKCDVIRQDEFAGFLMVHGTLERWHCCASMIAARIVRLPFLRQDTCSFDSSSPPQVIAGAQTVAAASRHAPAGRGHCNHTS